MLAASLASANDGSAAITNTNTNTNTNNTDQQDELVSVDIKTSAGDIRLQLNRSKAPITVDNFLTYVSADHYDGTIFHRVIKDFMIQGGGYTEKMKKKVTLPGIKNEADNGLLNQRGTVAMARTAVVDSATSQFFINVKDNQFLNHGVRDFGYAVFGTVTSGMEVVDAIAATATGARDRPLENIVITDVIVVEE
ncbi:peptidylprolyl isomerase A [Bacterioplanes sanyensis]|uniref:Peptidyl-prolyl cis-trans isomerase n=2 Tax=Bacterioplanes sanyensis TaxID=1249553 RepID=A0A222FQJ3_9GAMM|nr:peptidylprolyl isomerase A [Bacterioplanes sanyensis]